MHMRVLAGLTCAGALLVMQPTEAAQIQSIAVEHSDGRYRVRMHVLLDVTAARAYAAFADPHNLVAINPDVQDAHLLADGSLYTQVRTCAGPFCKTLRQQQQMRYSARGDGGHIWAQVVPEHSDLRSGTAQWEFSALGEHAQLDFEAELEPAFWIPPLIGPWLLENSMRAEAQRTSLGIEQVARQQAASAR
jgi:hypothetical protein